MVIYGQGMVDGHSCMMFSAHGKIQGQTAATTLINGLKKTLNCSGTSFNMVGDNKGVLSKCKNIQSNKLHTRRDLNMDLFLEYKANTSTFTRKNIMGAISSRQEHAMRNNRGLKGTKTTPKATLNVWCNKCAELARMSGGSFPDAEVFPTET